jgi:hypothetical protein
MLRPLKVSHATSRSRRTSIEVERRATQTEDAERSELVMTSTMVAAALRLSIRSPLLPYEFDLTP